MGLVFFKSTHVTCNTYSLYYVLTIVGTLVSYYFDSAELPVWSGLVQLYFSSYLSYLYVLHCSVQCKQALMSCLSGMHIKV